MNIPLNKITNAALKIHHDGSGDIPLGVSDGKRVSYLLLWPHIRPWRLRAPEPMMCALPDPAVVAARLSEALGGQPAPTAVALSTSVNRNLVSDLTANSPSTAPPERRTLMSQAIQEPWSPEAASSRPRLSSCFRSRR